MLEHASVGLVQWLPIPGRSSENLAYVVDQIRLLHGCDLIVLPELWVDGCDVAATTATVASVAEPLDGPRTRALSAAARKAGCWLVAGSVPEAADGVIFNTALVFDRSGELRGAHRKVHLYAPLGEDRIYSAGESLLVVDTDDFGPMGVVLCFAGDLPEVARTLGAAGSRFVVHPAAFECSAANWWDRLYPAHALSNGQWWISVNQCGTNGGVTKLGASRIISPLGDIVVEAIRVDEGGNAGAETLRADIDLMSGLDEWDLHCSVLRDGVRAGVSVARSDIRRPDDQATGSEVGMPYIDLLETP